MKTKLFSSLGKLFSLTVIFFLLSVFNLDATNPPLSTGMKNLSQGLLSAEYEDFVPEIVIEGNTIHAVWTNWVGNGEGHLFYCRSTDLGETWENAKDIYQYKDGGKAKTETAQRLAVSGNNVYIGVADYNYSNNGTGYIYLIKSTDGGANFGQATELANSGGGYSALSSGYIRASGSNVAIVYRDANYNNAFEGLYCLSSANSGNSFVKTSITTENTSSIADMIMDGNQIIVVHQYSYYYYGLNTGRVFVSVSNDNGATFKTNKVSVTYTDGNGDHEKCECYHDYQYVPKVAKDGNNIHVVFVGNNENGVWTTLYARSTNNGSSFEKAVDINNGKITGDLASGHESVAAKGGHVYLEFLRTNSKVYLVNSENSGATLSEPQSLLTDNTFYIQTTWWPQLVIDPTDETGKTVYFASGGMMSRKSVDGGTSFHNTTCLFPLFDNDTKYSAFAVDQTGSIHWLTKGRWYWTYDYDIFYTKKGAQPDPGEENKAYSIVTTWNDINEVAIVPSSPSIEFDSVMTGEAWVKMKPGSEYRQNIFTKLNGYDGDFYESPGYQITFDNYGGKRRLEAGIQTDKGTYMNWTGTDVKDTLWHHIALTYDANAGANNFKTYLDGLLVAESTVTGAIIPGDGMLLIGSRRSFNYNSSYLVDDIRLWNRALTQEELVENQTKKFTGNEDSLKLWLNFDGTFKDISGHGNDAVPIYLGNMVSSDFDPPLTAFEMYQFTNEISFNNKTTNANSWLWNFGNNVTSVQGNPKYTYTTPGEYQISLIAQNTTTVTSAIGHATIAGIDRVEPTEASNLGETLINIYGGGLSPDMQIALRFGDGTKIFADTVVGTGADGVLSALFALTGAKTGLWDVVVSKQGNETILPKSFTITEAEGVPEPWVNVSGQGAVLLNRWTKFTINYGNNGDVDALMVPVSFAVPDIEGLEVDYVDFKFVLPDEVMEYNLVEQLSPYKDFFIVESLFGKQQRSKVYSLMIPRIKANSAEALHILIKSSVNYTITSWTGDGWLQYTDGSASSPKKASLNQSPAGIKMNVTGADKEAGLCIVEALGVTAIETSISVIPVAGAVYNSFKAGYTVGQFDTKDGVKSVRNTALQGATTFFAYTSAVPVIGWVASTIGGLVCGAVSAYYAVSDCLSQPGKEKNVSAVSSFDPNEMIGPDGFGEKGWIPEIRNMPYTILFENKSEATAPAHDVFITDTLDLSLFDISDFGFGSFGWGDTIFSLNGNKLNEFSMDIDLRPNINLITRVSGKLDTITGIIRWEFLSLNPVTMNLEEDPFTGFLPPNVSSPEGEGFVSFSVALKEGLGTNTEIRNKASIVFDANKPIMTNEYINTLDLDNPESQVFSLDENTANHFNLNWAGTDLGSGIQDYTIWVMENDTNLYIWKSHTTGLSAYFDGNIGSTYKFYSIATDNVNYKELKSGTYDASTTVIVGIEDMEQDEESLLVFPNPADNKLQVQLKNAPVGLFVIEMYDFKGNLLLSKICEDGAIKNGVTVNVSDFSAGQYVLKLHYGGQCISKKVLIR